MHIKVKPAMLRQVCLKSSCLFGNLQQAANGLSVSMSEHKAP